jgi:carbonyl reductase 1
MTRRFIFVFLCVLISARLSPAMVLSAALLHPHKVALVTGANKGIGKEIARKLHAAGFTTVLGCRDPKLGDAAKNEILGTKRSAAESGAAVAVCPLDLADAASIKSCAEFVESTYGRLDVLVNNAAVCFNDPTLYGKVPHTPFEKQARLTVSTRNPKP